MAFKVRDGETLKMPDHTPPSLAAIIVRCWKRNPEERPNMEMLTQMLEDEYERTPRE